MFQAAGPRGDQGTAATSGGSSTAWASPEALIKLFAARSNCLRIVDRNGGLAMRNQEATSAPPAACAAAPTWARSGWRSPTTASSGPWPTPTPTPAARTSAVAWPAPSAAGSAAWARWRASIHTKKAEAQALVTLVDARTTEQLYVMEGVAQKTDISFGAGAGGYGWSGFAAAAGGGYANADQRQGHLGRLLQRLRRPDRLPAEERAHRRGGQPERRRPGLYGQGTRG